MTNVRAAPRHLSARRIVLLIVAVVAAWLVVGFLRAPSAATAAFVAAYPNNNVSATYTTTVPVVPPFFLVQVDGEIHSVDRFWDSRTGLYLVEPLTGWTQRLSGADPMPPPYAP